MTETPKDKSMSRWHVSNDRIKTPWFVWVLSVAFMLLIATWASLTLSLRAPDETAHFSSSVRVSEGFSWPDPGEARLPNAIAAAGGEVDLPQDERSTLNELAAAHPGIAEDRGDQMTQHPPLYYIITGAVLDLPGVKDLPWGQALFLLRLTGALLAAPLVWLTWNAVLTVTRSPRTAALAALMPFAVPQLAQNFGTLTNDSLAILLSWVVAWIGIKIWTGDRRPFVLLAIGLAFGASALSKGTALPMGLFVLIVLLAGPGAPSWPRRLLETAWPLAVAFVVGGWWWLRNLLRFGTLQPDGMGPFVSFPSWAPGEGPDVFYYIAELWRVTVTTFWGWFGRVNAPLPEPLVEALTVLCLTVVLVGCFRFRRDLPTVLALGAPIVAMAVLFIDTSWSAYAETTEPRGLHGRYFFTVLLLLILLAAVASRNLVREEGPRRVFAGVVTGATAMLVPGSLAVAVVGLWADYHLSSLGEALRTWLTGSPLVAAADIGLAVMLSAAFVAGFAGSAVATIRDRREFQPL